MTISRRPKYLLNQDLVQDAINEAEPGTHTIASLAKATNLTYGQVQLAVSSLRHLGRIRAERRVRTLYLYPKR